MFAERGTDFLTSPLSSNPADGRRRPRASSARRSSACIVALLAFPLGILTAVYLEEYAGEDRADAVHRDQHPQPGRRAVGRLRPARPGRVRRRCSRRSGRQRAQRPRRRLTLAVLVLPIVIITSAEALRAVPTTIREAGYGVGASRWQVIRQLVLPAAAPGILTGTVLALSRALGETAPLILVGAVLGSFSTAARSTELLTGPYTALPIIVYDWARKPQEEFRAADRGRDHRAARRSPARQRRRHLPPQPVRADLVIPTRGRPP